MRATAHSPPRPGLLWHLQMTLLPAAQGTEPVGTTLLDEVHLNSGRLYSVALYVCKAVICIATSLQKSGP